MFTFAILDHCPDLAVNNCAKCGAPHPRREANAFASENDFPLISRWFVALSLCVACSGTLAAATADRRVVGINAYRPFCVCSCRDIATGNDLNSCVSWLHRSRWLVTMRYSHHSALLHVSGSNGLRWLFGPGSRLPRFGSSPGRLPNSSS